jgi:hypothetical protein
MNWPAQFFVSIALGIQTLIGGFFPPRQSPQISSVQQTTTPQLTPMNVAIATSSSTAAYTLADLERFRLAGAAKQCTEPSPHEEPQTKYYVGNHMLFMNDEVTVPSSATDAYVLTQEYFISDGTTAYTWVINPDTKKVDAVYKYTEPIPSDDDTNDITCTDWTVDASVFVLPPGVKITDMVAPVPDQNKLDLERASILYARTILGGPVTKDLASLVQKVNASPRTDIPDLRAFVDKWASTIASMNAEGQSLKDVSLDSLNPADIDALSVNVDRLMAERINVLAALGALPSDEVAPFF